MSKLYFNAVVDGSQPLDEPAAKNANTIIVKNPFPNGREFTVTDVCYTRPSYVRRNSETNKDERVLGQQTIALVTDLKHVLTPAEREALAEARTSADPALATKLQIPEFELILMQVFDPSNETFDMDQKLVPADGDAFIAIQKALYDSAITNDWDRRAAVLKAIRHDDGSARTLVVAHKHYKREGVRGTFTARRPNYEFKKG